MYDSEDAGRVGRAGGRHTISTHPKEPAASHVKEPRELKGPGVTVPSCPTCSSSGSLVPDSVSGTGQAGWSKPVLELEMAKFSATVGRSEGRTIERRRRLGTEKRHADLLQGYRLPTAGPVRIPPALSPRPLSQSGRPLYRSTSDIPRPLYKHAGGGGADSRSDLAGPAD